MDYHFAPDRRGVESICHDHCPHPRGNSPHTSTGFKSDAIGFQYKLSCLARPRSLCQAPKIRKSTKRTVQAVWADCLLIRVSHEVLCRLPLLTQAANKGTPLVQAPPSKGAVQVFAVEARCCCGGGSSAWQDCSFLCCNPWMIYSAPAVSFVLTTNSFCFPAGILILSSWCRSGESESLKQQFKGWYTQRFFGTCMLPAVRV